MNGVSRLQAIIRDDPLRWRILGLVRALRLPDSWIGAGFVRNAVWDTLHGRRSSPLSGDVDVLWFDATQAEATTDRTIEARLRLADPPIPWSVKNQARMHRHNGDAPYASVTDAMRFWPETATAVAVRRTDWDDCEIAAPFGLDDLFGLILRPTPRFAHAEGRIHLEARARTKGWLTTWPLVRVPDLSS
jgi:uncharacterized protein